MKKRILPLLLSVVLCLSLLSTAFAAAGDTVSVAVGNSNGMLDIFTTVLDENGKFTQDVMDALAAMGGTDLTVSFGGGTHNVDASGQWYDKPQEPDDPNKGPDDDFNFVGGSSRPNVNGFGVVISPASHGSVNVSPIGAAQGTTVTIVATPDAGYVVGSVTVTDANGNRIQVTDLGDGRYTFVMPAVGVTVDVQFVAEEKPAEQQPSAPTVVTYSDVDPNAWYANAVSYVTLRGIMNGTGDGKFSPNATTTRGMVMTMLARMNGVDTEGGATWYDKGMQWAKAQGVSDGTNPNGVITREQLVTMLYRYMSTPASAEDIGRYPDASAVSEWALNAMQWGVESGLITGTGEGALNPGGTASRAEVATIMMRFCQTFGI